MSYDTFYDRYKELKSMYKIKHGTQDLLSPKQLKTLSLSEIAEALAEAIKEYDVVVKYSSTGYAHIRYDILRNAPGLSSQDLAIICDGGNLCFGYRAEGSSICVYTD